MLHAHADCVVLQSGSISGRVVARAPACAFTDAFPFATSRFTTPRAPGPHAVSHKHAQRHARVSHHKPCHTINRVTPICYNTPLHLLGTGSAPQCWRAPEVYIRAPQSSTRGVTKGFPAAASRSTPSHPPWTHRTPAKHTPQSPYALATVRAPHQATVTHPWSHKGLARCRLPLHALPHHSGVPVDVRHDLGETGKQGGMVGFGAPTR